MLRVKGASSGEYFPRSDVGAQTPRMEVWRWSLQAGSHGDFTAPSEVDASAAARMVDGVRHFVLKYR